MIQLIVRDCSTFHPYIRSRLLSNPDTLLRLSHDAEFGRRPVNEIADHFSTMLHDLRMAGAWKRTNRNRLKRTEEMLCKHIATRFHGNIVLLDVGASDGVTTVEAARALRSQFGQHVRCYVADINLWLFRYRRGILFEYRSRDGEPIMARLGCLGLRLSKPRANMEGTNDLFVRQYLRCRGLRESMALEEAISLLNPLARCEPGVEPTEFNCLVLQPDLTDRISAIRASNVLNLGYFRKEQVVRAISHLHAYLIDSGCLVISRNSDEEHGETENGSVWIRENHYFRWVEDFGTGSEVRDLVNNWSRTA